MVMQKTYRRSWRSDLTQALNDLQGPDGHVRTAFVGVGNELHAGDSIGIWIARALTPRFLDREDVLVLDGGLAPENLTGVLRQFSPHLVVFIDAAVFDLNEEPIRWLDWQETIGLTASTHSLPLHMVSSYLTQELGCEVGLLGIQVEGDGCSEAYMADVVSALEDVVAGMA